MQCMFIAIKMKTLWLLPMGNQVYVGKIQVLPETWRSSTGRRERMSLARSGGAAHHSCIHSGTTTMVNALFSSEAAKYHVSCSTIDAANDAPPCIPKSLLKAASHHMKLAATAIKS